MADTVLAQKCLSESERFLSRGQMDSAMQRTELAIGIYRAVLGDKSAELARAISYKGRSLSVIGQFTESLKYIDESLQMFRQVAPNNQSLGFALLYKGNVLSGMGQYQEALENYEKAKDFLLPILGENNQRMAGVFGSLGIGYSNIGNHNNAIYYYKKAEDFYLLNREKNKYFLSLAHENMGLTYLRIGNYTKALNYLLSSAELQEQTGFETSPGMATTYSNISIVFSRFGDYKSAVRYIKKSLEIDEKVGTNPYHHVMLGNYYTRLGQYDDAITALHQSIESYESDRANSDPGERSLAYYYLGRLLQAMSAFGAADSAYLKGLDILRNFPQSNQLNYVTLYNALGQNAAFLAEFTRADQFFEQSEGYFGQRKEINPDIDRELPLLHCFRGTMYLNWYKKTNNETVLRKAYKSLETFDQTIDRLKPYLHFDPIKQVLNQTYRPGYESAITTAHQSYVISDSINYIRDAFTYAEKTKSLLLYEGTQDANALHFSGIPDSLLDREYKLRVDIAYQEQKRFELENQGVALTDSALLSLSGRLFDLRQQYESLKKTFETDYSDYYRLKYDLRVEDVPAVQRDLLYPDMALVEYFVGDSAVYIFTIRKQDYSVLEIKKDFPLEQWVAQLRRGMTGFHTDPDMAAQYDSLSALYTEAASNIYEKLVAPIAAKLPAKVIVIPDGVLGYVPFEALLVEKPGNPTRWSQHHYLLNDHSVSYCYSATMLREMLYRRHKQAPDLNFLGFAPQYDGDTALLATLYPYADDMRKDLAPLPHSGEEVFRGARLMKGEAVVGAGATKAAFEEKASRARILHLATHGQANDRAGDYCFLVFADQKDSAENEILYARDIYNLRLNADLVTLSACETGIGELQSGEGIISLARAFAYAGAKSIVTSLWSVSDAKTKDLMLDFYRNLRRGMLKDDALRQAKLDFLKRNRGQAAHPFYWAGFVGIGNMGKVR